MKRIVVTGATGMIGSCLAKAASLKGIKVLCIVREDTIRLENLPNSPLIEIIHADLDEYADLVLPDKYDTFFHLAWNKTCSASRDDTNTQAANIQFTLDAVQLAHKLGCQVFIGAGSQAECGLLDEPLRVDTVANPGSGYGIAKYAAGKLSRLLCSQLGMRHNWARILSVYGPLDAEHSLVMYAVNELRQGRSPLLTKCEQIWDYLYCDDAAEALLAIGERGMPDKVYPLGAGERRRLAEYLAIIRDAIDPSLELGFGKRAYYPYQPMFLSADISELTKDTGWAPLVPFEDGVREILRCVGH